MTLSEEERCVFELARHFASLGPQNKYLKSNISAKLLNNLAKFYNNAERFEEAKLYASAALNLSSKNQAGIAMIYLNLIEAQFAMIGRTSPLIPDESSLNYYKKALDAVELQWNADHPLAMILHDRMAVLCNRYGNAEAGYEYQKKSMGIALRTLGKNNIVTADQFNKVWWLILSMLIYVCVWF